MHIFLITRGVKNAVDTFISELQGKYLPIRWNEPGPDGNVIPVKGKYIQVGVQPMQIWSINFPEEHRDMMLRSIFGNFPEPQHKRHNKIIAIIRRMLGIDKPGDYKKEGEKMLIAPGDIGDIEKVFVGEKKDYYLNADGSHSDAWQENTLHEGI